MREGYKSGGKTEMSASKPTKGVAKAKKPMTAGAGSGVGRLQKIGKDPK